MNNELLSDYGIDYEMGLRSCMGDGAFYKRMLSMFINDSCFAKARAAHAARDYKELFCRMHELKGVSGNVALTALHKATVPLVELLRKDAGAHDQIDRLFAEAEAEYLRACEGIALLIAEPKKPQDENAAPCRGE